MEISKSFKILLVTLLLMVTGILTLGYSRPYGVTDDVDAERIYNLAIRNNDVSICAKLHLTGLGDMTEGQIKDACYRRYVAAHPDQDVCPRNSFGCIDARAVALGKASECLTLQFGGDKALCVFDVAYKKDDLTICNVLAVSSELQMCRQHWINSGQI